MMLLEMAVERFVAGAMMKKEALVGLVKDTP